MNGISSRQWLVDELVRHRQGRPTNIIVSKPVCLHCRWLLGSLLLHPLSLRQRIGMTGGGVRARLDAGHVRQRPVGIFIKSSHLNARLVNLDAERANQAWLAQLSDLCLLEESFLGLTNFEWRLPGFPTEKTIHIGLAEGSIDTLSFVRHFDHSF